MIFLFLFVLSILSILLGASKIGVSSGCMWRKDAEMRREYTKIWRKYPEYVEKKAQICGDKIKGDVWRKYYG